MNILLKTAVVMAATIALAPSISHATSDYVVIQRGGSDLNDATNQAVLEFDLPNTVLISGATANSAALVLEVDGGEFSFNEMYINPANENCDNDASDGNDAQSIGNIRRHEDPSSKNEVFTSVKTFSSSLLTSGTNTLLICARNSSGGDSGNIDDFEVRNIMLHYKKQ